MIQESKWIRPAVDLGDVVPEFFRGFTPKSVIESAYLTITGLGVYEARLNGERVGEFIMAPGWTTYKKRLQYQTYDVTELIREGKENILQVLLGKVWYRSRLVAWESCAAQVGHVLGEHLHVGPAQAQQLYLSGTGGCICVADVHGGIGREGLAEVAAGGTDKLSLPDEVDVLHSASRT